VPSPPTRSVFFWGEGDPVARVITIGGFGGGALEGTAETVRARGRLLYSLEHPHEILRRVSELHDGSVEPFAELPIGLLEIRDDQFVLGGEVAIEAHLGHVRDEGRATRAGYETPRGGLCHLRTDGTVPWMEAAIVVEGGVRPAAARQALRSAIESGSSSPSACLEQTSISRSSPPRSIRRLVTLDAVQPGRTQKPGGLRWVLSSDSCSLMTRSICRLA